MPTKKSEQASNPLFDHEQMLRHTRRQFLEAKKMAKFARKMTKKAIAMRRPSRKAA